MCLVPHCYTPETAVTIPATESSSEGDAFPSCSTQAYALTGLESATKSSISWLVHGHESLQLVWEHAEHATCPALVRDSPLLAEL